MILYPPSMYTTSRPFHTTPLASQSRLMPEVLHFLVVVVIMCCLFAGYACICFGNRVRAVSSFGSSLYNMIQVFALGDCGYIYDVSPPSICPSPAHREGSVGPRGGLVTHTLMDMPPHLNSLCLMFLSRSLSIHPSNRRPQSHPSSSPRSREPLLLSSTCLLSSCSSG